VGLLESIELSDVPRGYPATSFESDNYKQSKEKYEAGLKHVANKYACGYESFCDRLLQVSDLLSLRRSTSTWGSDLRHDSVNAQHAFDKCYGLTLYESGKSFLLRVGESIINSRISNAGDSKCGGELVRKRNSIEAEQHSNKRARGSRVPRWEGKRKREVVLDGAAGNTL
jgi:hypothetical protein